MHAANKLPRRSLALPDLSRDQLLALVESLRPLGGVGEAVEDYLRTASSQEQAGWEPLCSDAAQLLAMGSPGELVTVRTIASPEAQSCLDAGEPADLTLLSDDQRFRVHTSAMAAASDFLAALFGAGMTDSTAREVALREVTATELQALLELVYHGECSVRCGGLPALLITAARLQMPTAQRAVEGAIASRLTAANVLDAWELAEQHNLPALREAAEALGRETFDFGPLDFGPLDSHETMHPGYPRDIPCKCGRLQWLKLDRDRGISFERAAAHVAELRLASGGGLFEGEGFYVSHNFLLGREKDVLAYALLICKSRHVVHDRNNEVALFRVFRPGIGPGVTVTLAEFTQKLPSGVPRFKLIAEDDPQLAAGWTRLYDDALSICAHGPRCKNGSRCTVGKRVQTRSMLIGSAIPHCARPRPASAPATGTCAHALRAHIYIHTVIPGLWPVQIGMSSRI